MHAPTWCFIAESGSQLRSKLVITLLYIMCWYWRTCTEEGECFVSVRYMVDKLHCHPLCSSMCEDNIHPRTQTHTHSFSLSLCVTDKRTHHKALEKGEGCAIGRLRGITLVAPSIEHTSIAPPPHTILLPSTSIECHEELCIGQRLCALARHHGVQPGLWERRMRDGESA